MAYANNIIIDGTPIEINVSTINGFTVNKNVPADAVFSDTTYTAGTGLSLINNTFSHSNSITPGTIGSSTDTSGLVNLHVPYVNFDAQGHITGGGNRIHTVTGFIQKTGGVVTGNINRKNSNVTIGTTSNNGVVSGNEDGCYDCTDSNDEYYGRFCGRASDDGSVTAFIEARNMKTDGSFVSNRLSIGVKKDGTRTFSVSDPSKFREDLNLQKEITTETSSTGNNGFSLKRYGKVVSIQGIGVTANNRGTLPSGWRPEELTRIPCVVFNGSNYYYGWLALNNSNGAITVHYLNGTSDETTTSASYSIHVSGTWEII